MKPRGEFRPMLACPAPTEGLTFPLIGSPKVDGVRCVVRGGVALSRKLEPIPNQYLQRMLGNPLLEGLDGELCVGAPSSDTVFNDTMRGVMRQDGMPQFTLWVFDAWNMPEDVGYALRLARLKQAMALEPYSLHPHLRMLPSTTLNSMEELTAYQEDQLEQGYEGVMVRSPDGPYKHGRSTAKQGWLMKVKRFSDGEAVVTGATELMHNANELEADALGLAKRSSAQDGLVPGGVLGSLQVTDVTTGVEFSIGSGFDAAQREQFWRWHLAGQLVGLTVAYKHFEVGVKTAPRFPVFKGWRAPIDIGDPAP